MNDGSVILILSNGRHITKTDVFTGSQKFHNWVRNQIVSYCQYDADLKFVLYAFNGECQKYTAADAMEVYFGRTLRTIDNSSLQEVI